MVSKVLRKMIRRAEAEYIQGFVVGTRGCRISHLQFADDTMIFCNANETQLGFLRCILCCFEAISGLSINLDKSEMF